jgi:putative ABC transport system permease protein
VGITRFGPDNDALGATLLQLDPPTAQQWFGLTGLANELQLRLDNGADVKAVTAALQQALPTGIELIDNSTLLDETSADYITVVDLFATVLLAFAFVSLFVSSFIIANTFAIVVGQRTRELALMRALGADRRQVRRMVLIEAGVVGVVSSVVGIGAGVGMSVGLRALRHRVGCSASGR